MTALETVVSQRFPKIAILHTYPIKPLIFRKISGFYFKKVQSDFLRCLSDAYFSILFFSLMQVPKGFMTKKRGGAAAPPRFRKTQTLQKVTVPAASGNLAQRCKRHPASPRWPAYGR